MFDASTCILVTTLHHDPWPAEPHPLNDTLAPGWLAEGVVDGIVDWAAEVAADPSLVRDAYGHLTPAGQLAYASFVRAELAAQCGL